ncbi:restriction endonuclease [Corallococcus sp. AB004]|nr:restriction endonuclease [Corallococcus sp. AB004]
MSGIGDRELSNVCGFILKEDPEGVRIGQTLRNSIDQLLDGQHSGRYKWEQLYKTEKTHAGTLVEINLQREFGFRDGLVLDYEIEGVETDCKFSQSLNGWMFPPEAEGHLCLVVWASDEKSRWSVGVVRARTEYLSVGENRDRKRTLNQAGRSAVKWVFKDSPLPSNVFLRLSESQIRNIFEPKSGQKRVNRLFVHAQGQVVGRAAIATAAQQDDFMKRARDNGGAREKLRPCGIVILGHEHQRIARDLGLSAIPMKGELVSVRLVRIQSRRTNRMAATIDGGLWAIAREDEPIEQAPQLPRAKRAGNDVEDL